MSRFIKINNRYILKTSIIEFYMELDILYIIKETKENIKVNYIDDENVYDKIIYGYTPDRWLYKVLETKVNF